MNWCITLKVSQTHISDKIMLLLIDFKMLSLNARSIRSLEKRQALLIWLQKQKVDIMFLQETYRAKEVENIWKRQWKGPKLRALSCAKELTFIHLG